MFDATDRRLTRGCVFVIVVIIACCLAADIHYGGNRRSAFTPIDVDFSDGWKDSDAAAVSLPGTFGLDGDVIHMQKRLPDGLTQEALMVVSSSYLPVKASIDGVDMEVGGTFIDGAFNVTYANSRSVIRIGTEFSGKTISLDFLSSGQGSKFAPEIYSIWLGSAPAIQAYSLLGSEYTNTIVLAMLIIGLVMIMLAIFLFMRKARESCYDILLSASYLIMCAIWFFTDIGDNTIRYGYSGAYLFINLFSFLLIAVALVLLIRNHLNVGKRLLACMSAAPIIMSLCVVVLLMTGRFCLSVTLTVSHALIILIMAAITACLSKDLFINKNKDVMTFFVSAIILIATGLATMLSFYCFCLPDNTLYYRYGLVVITLVLAVRTISMTVTRTIDARNIEKLRHAASHDALTGIYNREAFYSKTQAMLGRNSGRVYLIGSLDIERFSLINDVFGREQGNDILCFIAKVLGNLFDGDGTYARLESDKFLFCFSRDRFEVPLLCEALQSEVSKYVLDYSVILSFGFYIITGDNLSVAAMVDRACIARETIKDNYIKRWAIYDDSLRRAMLHKQTIINTLDSSLENGDIWMALQPKYSLSTMQIDGAEALARWRHPTLGNLSPMSFIPELEKNGLIIKLDSYIWELAAERVRCWIDEFGEKNTPPISINVSRMHLFRTNLVEILTDIITRHGIPARLIALEITESVYSADPATLSRITDELHQMGFKIHMDDFGSGYSSLNMLKNVRVDVIKLDMGFLMGGGNDGRSFEIIKAVVSMATALGIHVVAEGVETMDQASILREIGCNEAQGYCFGRPGPASDVTRLIRNRLSA